MIIFSHLTLYTSWLEVTYYRNPLIIITLTIYLSNLFFRLFPGINNLMIVKIGRLHFGHNCLPVHLKCINLSESDILTIHQMATSIITFSSVQNYRTLDRNYIRKLSAYNFPLLWELLTRIIFQNQQSYFSWKSSNLLL